MNIKKWLSRYYPRYVRSLVYMLQASEYHVRDYLTWYERVDDFRHVERRKKLIKTDKATLLFIAGWVLLVIYYWTGLTVFLVNPGFVGFIVGLAIILITPFLVAYSLLAVLFVVNNVIQRPIEYIKIRQTKQALDRHQGIKIAIAGSFGKTTMREILKTVLAEGKRVAAPSHSYNTPLGISDFIKSLLGDEDVLIFELGEYYPEDITKLCNMVKPEWGIITGINEAHLEKFGNLEATSNTIFELAECVGTKPLYVNGENELALNKALSHYIVYSRDGAGEWKVENPRTDLSGTSFTLVREDARLDVHTKLLGLHQIGPLAAAADIASRLGLSPDQIKRGIENIRPFEHRLEPKDDGSGVIILDDSYNGNPDGVRAVIEFLSSLKNHRRFYVTPGLVEMGSRTEAVHREIGALLAQAGIEKVVLIKNSATPFIKEGLKESGYTGEIIWFDDALAAFAALPHMTVKGDVVLLQNDWPDQYQ